MGDHFAGGPGGIAESAHDELMTELKLSMAEEKA
jgi:hypothetical protein